MRKWDKDELESLLGSKITIKTKKGKKKKIKLEDLAGLLIQLSAHKHLKIGGEDYSYNRD